MSKQVVTKLVVNTRKRNKATTFFRPILILPILIFVSTFSSNNSGTVSISFLELQNRISLYALYLTDEFPSIEKSKNVTISLPDVKGGKALNRWLPLVKWFLAIPLYVVGAVYLAVTVIYTIIAWFNILFTGKYPKFAINFVVGTVQFWNRVTGYAFILVTDEYPTFSVKATK